MSWHTMDFISTSSGEGYLKICVNGKEIFIREDPLSSPEPANKEEFIKLIYARADMINFKLPEIEYIDGIISKFFIPSSFDFFIESDEIENNVNNVLDEVKKLFLNINRLSTIIIDKILVLNDEKKNIDIDDIKSVVRKVFFIKNDETIFRTSDVETKIDYAIQMLLKKNNIKGLGKNITCQYENMDDNNKKATDILVGRPDSEFFKYVFIDQNSGKTLSYPEMRSRFG